MLKTMSFILLFNLTFFTTSCGNKKTQPTPAQVHQQVKVPKAHFVDEGTLKQWGWNIPADNSTGNRPSQVGQISQGKTVSLDANGDLPWTAFTLLIYAHSANSYEVFLQKRSHNNSSGPGSIETAGGHLLPKQSWREGAVMELGQETGIQIPGKRLFYLNGANERVNKSGHLYGNANFFVVFWQQKPQSKVNPQENDPQFGHQWQPLKRVYQNIKNEHQQKPGQSGVYYNFFRSHLMYFCQNVLGWP